MRVASDLDNVLVGIIASAKAALARDLSIPEDDIIDTNVYWVPFTHADPEIAAKLIPDHAFWDRDDVLSLSPPLPGAVEAAWRLYNAGLLACYITRRPDTVAAITRNWVAKHNLPALPIEHVGNTDPEVYFARCKSTVCQRYGVTHIIDDHAGEADMLAKAGIEVILVDAEVGRAKRQEFHASHPHITLVPDVNAAAEFLINQTSAAA